MRVGVFDLRIGVFVCVSDFISGNRVSSFFCFLEMEKSLNFEFSNEKRQILRDFTFLQHHHGSARSVERIPNIISSPIPACYTLCDETTSFIIILIIS